MTSGSSKYIMNEANSDVQENVFFYTCLGWTHVVAGLGWCSGVNVFDVFKMVPFDGSTIAKNNTLVCTENPHPQRFFTRWYGFQPNDPGDTWIIVFFESLFFCRTRKKKLCFVKHLCWCDMLICCHVSGTTFAGLLPCALLLVFLWIRSRRSVPCMSRTSLARSVLVGKPSEHTFGRFRVLDQLVVHSFCFLLQAARFFFSFPTSIPFVVFPCVVCV